MWFSSSNCWSKRSPASLSVSLPEPNLDAWDDQLMSTENLSSSFHPYCGLYLRFGGRQACCAIINSFYCLLADRNHTCCSGCPPPEPLWRCICTVPETDDRRPLLLRPLGFRHRPGTLTPPLRPPRGTPRETSRYLRRHFREMHMNEIACICFVGLINLFVFSPLFPFHSQ